MEVVVSVNGRIVSKTELALTYPMDGDQILFVPEIQGGGGDDKAILRTVAIIAVTATAMAITGGLAATAGGWFVQGSFSAYALGATVGIAGSMLVNALLPPPKPNLPTMDFDGASQVYS